AYLNTVSYTNTTSDKVKLTLTGGSTITRVYTMANNRGSAKIYIDGVNVDTTNDNTAETRWQVAKTWTLSGNSSTSHTIEVKNNGGGYIDADAFIKDIGTVGDGVYDNTNSQLKYIGNWAASSSGWISIFIVVSRGDEMWRKNTLPIVLGLLILFGFLAASNIRLQASYIPNNQESKDVMTVLNRFYEITGAPIETFEPNQLAEVLLDTSDFNLTDGWRTYLSTILDEEVVNRAGFLTAMQTKWTHLQQGDALARAAMAKAEAEKREVTQDEWDELTEQNHGMLPPGLYRGEPGYTTELKFESVNIEDEQAIVLYDDGAALYKAILRLVNKQWFIVDVTPIDVHF
ncbi:MAG: hypothetical protein KDE50_34730, partial [Caldilineaceae bacterium]|nr:hypothetical protein [Caldilineaceae bacterium]